MICKVLCSKWFQTLLLMLLFPARIKDSLRTSSGLSCPSVHCQTVDTGCFIHQMKFRKNFGRHFFVVVVSVIKHCPKPMWGEKGLLFYLTYRLQSII